MTDNERIEALHSEGRITREQADMLLAALEEQDAFAAEAEAEAEAGPASAATELVADELRWLELSALGGDFDIEVRAGLTAPVSEDGYITLTSDGAKVALAEDDNDDPNRNFIDRLLDRISSNTGRLSVQLPAGWGVKLNVKGGDIDITGPIAALRGHLMAGDLKVTETAQLDLTLNAGEAEIGLRASSGEHRLRVHVGSAEVRVLPGSSLDVSATVNVGNVTSNRLSSSQVSVVGSAARGRIGGTGAAGTLNVSVATGDARIHEVVRG